MEPPSELKFEVSMTQVDERGNFPIGLPLRISIGYRTVWRLSQLANQRGYIMGNSVYLYPLQQMDSQLPTAVLEDTLVDNGSQKLVGDMLVHSIRGRGHTLIDDMCNYVRVWHIKDAPLLLQRLAQGDELAQWVVLVPKSLDDRYGVKTWFWDEDRFAVYEHPDVPEFKVYISYGRIENASPIDQKE